METITGTVVMVLPGPSGLTIALRTTSGPRVGLATGPLAGQLAGTMQAGEVWSLDVYPNTIVAAARFGAPAPAPAG